VFEEGKAKRYAAEANLILSRALLAQGQLVEARQRIERVAAMAKESHNSWLEWAALITAARIQAASGSPANIGESVSRLEKIVAEAAAAGFPDVALEARLALGEIELKGGKAHAGRPRLESLEKDSANAGARLISLKASAALNASANRGAN
jgi:hypothetical protein